MLFQDVVRGEYGRKVAKTSVDVITPDNIVSVVGKTIGIFNFNKTVIDYLWRYYKGDHPIRYRNKTVRNDVCNNIVENHVYEYVQFKVGQSYGEPIQYISNSDDDRVTFAVDKLNDYAEEANKHEKDIKAGEWQSAVGTSYKAVQLAEPFRIVAPNPLNTYVIYNESTEEPIMAVQELKDDNGKTFKMCYTSTHSCKIIDSKVYDWKLHIFGDIPIVEFPNNTERLSDIELIIDLQDAIDNMQSNRMDSIEQFVQSWIKFINCDIDSEKYEQMKREGAIVVRTPKGVDARADVDIMTQELNQTQTQVAKQDLIDNALSILGIPNKQGNTGGDSQGAVELRNGWDFSKSRAKLKDAVIKSAEKRMAKLMLRCIRLRSEDLEITTKDFDIQINHSPLDNLYTKVQALVLLLQAGINPMVAVKTVGIWGDSEKTYLLSKKYFDAKYFTVDNMESGENNGNSNNQNSV